MMEQDVHTLLGVEEEEADNAATDVHVQFNKMLHGGSSSDEVRRQAVQGQANQRACGCCSTSLRPSACI